MNEQIKKRISAINIGIIPDGYKKTKVGIVPAEWEIKTLAELCEISAGGDIEKEHCQTTPNEKFKFPVYSNALTNKGLYGYSDIFKISEKTVTVTGRGEIGYAIARNEKYYPIVRLLVLKPKNENINTVFLAHQINESKIYIESTGVPQLTAPQLSLLKIFCPSLKEQIIIAEILSTQDKLIELYERKIEQLKTLKKGYLQKMFPKKGCKYPELRFKGFTDDWEQRKLGEIMNVTSVKRIHQSDWTYSGVRFLRARDIVAAYKNEKSSDYLYISQDKYEEYSSLCGKVNKGDLLVTGVGTIGVPMLINDENPLYFKDGNIIWFQNENKINANFLYYSFIGNAIQSFIQESAGTGTVGTYTIDSGKKTPIALPKYMTEQHQIGAFFANLDRLITLHQHKLDKEKQKKKALMQLLLTGKVRVST